MKTREVVIGIAGVAAGIMLSKTISNTPNYYMPGMGMMDWKNIQLSNQVIEEAQKHQDEGGVLFEKLQRKEVSCQQLENSDFEKIGDFVMGRRVGNTTQHTIFDQHMKSMMGEEAEEQMHIALGKGVSGCDSGNNFDNGMMWMMRNPGLYER